MIDIHSHILPGVDDGADSLETSRKLLLQYASQGVDCVICTSHQNKMLLRTDILRCEFNKFLQEVSDIPVRLYLGAEILYYTGMVKDLQEGKLLTLGGSKYVLIEFPVHCNAGDICDAVYELVIAKYVPIIAHIERYVNLTKQDYLKIKNEGALIQINANSVKGKYTAKVAKYLLKKGLVDFISSDCHDVKFRNADFTLIKEYVRKKFPKQYDKLFNRTELQ
ncbi:MAG: tyrosine-protein phosphatase [Candidatus Coproplasma sp.]